jgi:hypothetical protein
MILIFYKLYGIYLKCFDSELGRKLYFLEGGTTDCVQVKVVIINIRIFYSLYVCKRLFTFLMYIYLCPTKVTTLIILSKTIYSSINYINTKRLHIKCL